MATHSAIIRDGEIDSTARVGDALPKALNVAQMCTAFGVSYATFYRKEKLGEFRTFELARPIGDKRWSGDRVQRFLNGDAL
jgi:hypothetical protein